ncbi:MAG: hypothetical protein WC804_18880 [Sphingomonas sp.]|jgi:hypothetical protein|uniref:hypothetical protein n=1 Tax=Sphingomonas sp. TaxID=28214 RepID=UPI0035649A3B
MTPGSTFNWILAVVMLGFAVWVGLAGRLSLRGGEVLDRAEGPIRFWAFVIVCGMVGAVLLGQAVFHFR